MTDQRLTEQLETSAADAPTTFTCAHCHRTFTHAWTEEEARAEAEQWGDELEKQGEAVVCDDCYHQFMHWAKDEGLV